MDIDIVFLNRYANLMKVENRAKDKSIQRVWGWKRAELVNNWNARKQEISDHMSNIEQSYKRR